MPEGTSKSINQVLLEFEELRYRLEEAEQTLTAIREGEVDALVVYGERGEQVFSLRGAEQPYREFVEQIQEGAASVTADGLVLWANQRLAEMLGIPLSQVIGAPVSEIFGREQANALAKLFDSAEQGVSRTELTMVGSSGAIPVMASASRLTTGEAAFAVTLTDISVHKRHDEALAAVLAIARAGATARGLEAMIETPDGIRDILVGVGPLGLSGGGVVVTLTDITERNEAFRFAQHMNETLERRVEERTEELIALNRELEGFCYSVSHDLRAPLRGMNSASQMLIEDYGDGIPPAAQSELHRIARNATRLAQLMDDLLAFSRLGRKEMRVQEVDLSVIGRSVAEDHVGEGVEICVAEGLRTAGDPSLLRLMVGNLIGNGVKFSQQKEGARVVFEAGDEPETFVVRDNGIGFKPEYAEKIFRPFERLHTEQEYPGTGIGLANVERIVRRHGGRVWAEAELGHGARFYFRIPLSGNDEHALVT